MATESPKARFIPFSATQVESFPNKSHYWYCRPDQVGETDLLFVRVKIPPGQGHKFHSHPRMEEILYVLSGMAEQWVEGEKRLLGPGDALHVAAGVVHATYNSGEEELDFLAVLAPASAPGPGTVDMSEEEPWRSLRP